MSTTHSSPLARARDIELALIGSEADDPPKTFALDGPLQFRLLGHLPVWSSQDPVLPAEELRPFTLDVPEREHRRPIVFRKFDERVNVDRSALFPMPERFHIRPRPYPRGSQRPNMRPRQAILFGGGLDEPAFNSPDGLIHAAYIAKATGVAVPRFLLLADAMGTKYHLVDDAFEAFGLMGCKMELLALTGREFDGEIADRFENIDGVLVLGGPSRSRQALWRTWNVDGLVRSAYEQGVLVAGTSDGMCMALGFTPHGAAGPNAQKMLSGTLEGLRLIPGLDGAPHFDEWARRIDVRRLIESGKMKTTIALAQRVGGHFLNGMLIRAITGAGRVLPNSSEGEIPPPPTDGYERSAFMLDIVDGNYRETRIPVTGLDIASIRQPLSAIPRLYESQPGTYISAPDLRPKHSLMNDLRNTIPAYEIGPF